MLYADSVLCSTLSESGRHFIFLLLGMLLGHDTQSTIGHTDTHASSTNNRAQGLRQKNKSTEQSQTRAQRRVRVEHRTETRSIPHTFFSFSLSASHPSVFAGPHRRRRRGSTRRPTRRLQYPLHFLSSPRHHDLDGSLEACAAARSSSSRPSSKLSMSSKAKPAHAVLL